MRTLSSKRAISQPLSPGHSVDASTALSESITPSDQGRLLVGATGADGTSAPRQVSRLNTGEPLESQLIGDPAALRGGASWEQIAELLGVLRTSRGTLHTEGFAERPVADATATACDLTGGRPLH